MQPVRRRQSSSYGSTQSLRRSSLSSRDLQQIQQAFYRSRAISGHTVLVLLLFIPSFSFFLLHSVYYHNGLLWETLCSLVGKYPFFARIVPPVFDLVAWKIVFVLFSVQLLLYEVLPRDTALVLSSNGDKVREINSFSSLVVLSLSYVLGAALGLYQGDIVYVHLPSVVACLATLATVSSLLLCAYYRITDTHLVETLYEFFFGVELEPTLLEIDVKHFLRSRVAYGLYSVIVISTCFFRRNAHGPLNYTFMGAASAHYIYILLWQWSEELQLNGIDAKRGNFGWFRLWGDLVLYPVLYATPFLTMANKKRQINILFAVPFIIGAIVSSVLNFLATRERYRFRRAKGNCKVWGRDPYFITAKYRGDTGETVANELLGSGYWGYCRHPNYAMDLVSLFCLAALPGWSGLMCHSSFLFLLAYFLIRISYDEQRCHIKYGNAWQNHCHRVTFLLFPGIY